MNEDDLELVPREGTNRAYIVLIEWDGKKPPTTYYNRMRRIAGMVRGNALYESERRSALTFRGEAKYNAMVIQEGAVMCASKMVAYYVATTARNLGAKYVYVAESQELEFDGGSPEDRMAIARMEKALSRIGRPPAKEKTESTVVAFFCRECGVKRIGAINTDPDDTFEVCTHCGSFPVNIAPVEDAVMQAPTDAEVRLNPIDAWARLRFSTGNYMHSFTKKEIEDYVKLVGIDAPLPKLVQHKIPSKLPEGITDTMMLSMLNSPRLVEQAARLARSYDQRKILSALDAMYFVGLSWDEHKRQMNRLANFAALSTEISNSKGMKAKISKGLLLPKPMFDPNDLDILDSVNIGPRYTAYSLGLYV